MHPNHGHGTQACATSPVSGVADEDVRFGVCDALLDEAVVAGRARLLLELVANTVGVSPSRIYPMGSRMGAKLGTSNRVALARTR